MAFRKDLINIARTTLSSKILTAYKEKFSELAVDAVLRLKKSGNLEAIQIIKKLGGKLSDSYLDDVCSIWHTFCGQLLTFCRAFCLTRRLASTNPR